MSSSVIMLTLFALALVTWAGLFYFMNEYPPDIANQVLFLAIWGGAITLTMIPISYAVGARSGRYGLQQGQVNLSIRRGLLLGLLATLLMALRFLRLLNVTMGITLTLLVLALEVLLSVRGR